MAKKLVFSFGGGKAEGSDRLRDLLGGKGAGLAEMSRSGAPVPPGFTITTDACRAYTANPKKGVNGIPGLKSQFELALRKLEAQAGRKLGDAENPLLVSVRSGAKFSMPGMMDTILNLGLSADCVEGLARLTGDRRFALDSRRRFIQMFGNVVRGIEKDLFEHPGRDLGEPELEKLVARYLEVYKKETGEDFPEDPRKQLFEAVEAVFKSWGNARAVTYRKLHKIPEDLGTACNVQMMVFGNRGVDSGTGVGFTRNPASGAKEFFGEYLSNAQGEDVVAGIRTPLPLARLRDDMPKVYDQLHKITGQLERYYRDAQDFEFTVEQGRLYMLQTRRAKRTAAAALRIAVDMVKERLISKEEAILRVEPETLDQLLKPVFDDRARGGHPVLAKGLPAGPGAASGRIAFNADDAVKMASEGPVILVRPETNPDDIHGMIAAQGILTATGGMTSHAAVVGRGLGKVCVVGCGALHVNGGAATVNGHRLAVGDYVSIDGFTGEVLEGKVQTQPSEILQALEGRKVAQSSELFEAYETFMGWADRLRRLKVRANADRPEDARIALLLGAEGIGLCRTEHMFFGEDRIPKIVAMIAARTPEERKRALDGLFPLQKDDFKAIFKVMGGLPVTIRTIDPPLHEFLPHTREEAEERGSQAGIPAEDLWRAAEELREINPMLGHRGCRLGITHPEITEMQARAILSAAREVLDAGTKVHAEIMVPLVGFPSELKDQKAIIDRVGDEVDGHGLKYDVGTMIEVPRAAWAAADIAKEAAFFSFGTNDLTQMMLGYSRDDYGKFIGDYLAKGILPADPFQTIDLKGVGAAVRQTVQAARRVKKGMKLGVCGEHGGDPASIRFFHEIELDYVSCSPYRVPVARLAAAQAAVLEDRGETPTTA